MFASFSAYSQQTSMTVDNQTPGWLSSKIVYTDQRTLKNLKVTGYINSTDLQFIGQLIAKYSLDGRLDLEDANVIASDAMGEDSVLTEDMFGIKGSGSKKLKHLILPLSAKKSDNCMGSY